MAATTPTKNEGRVWHLRQPALLGKVHRKSGCWQIGIQVKSRCSMATAQAGSIPRTTGFVNSIVALFAALRPRSARASAAAGVGITRAALVHVRLQRRTFILVHFIASICVVRHLVDGEFNLLQQNKAQFVLHKRGAHTCCAAAVRSRLDFADAFKAAVLATCRAISSSSPRR